MHGAEVKIARQVRATMRTAFAQFVEEAMNYLKPDGGERVLTTTVKITPMDNGSAPYHVELEMRETIGTTYDRIVYRAELRGYF